ncbi:hypothetical protein [Streptomyces sp. NPDC048636]|uniref:hypothetical protein n=1 Tax=Streptomyces sp. NPDC048636 TaxID=3155762 RepID=UPI003420C6ED
MDRGSSPGTPSTMFPGAFGMPSRPSTPPGGGPPPSDSSPEAAEWSRMIEALSVLSRRRLVDLDNPTHLDALADRLYERVITHVRRELVVERERHGLLTPRT